MDGLEGSPEVECMVSVPNNPSNNANPESRKRKACETSKVWTHFDKVVVKNEDGSDAKDADGKVVMKACCKICNEKLTFGGNSGTSHLIRHMTSCLKKSACEGGQPIVGRSPTGEVYYFSFNQKRARQETVKYFVLEEIAFNKISKPTFHRWIKKSFGPQFRPPCRQTMKNDVMEFYNDKKSVLRGLLKSVPGKISLTSDLWTSKQKLGYMCITAHYITSDWKLNKRVINFPMLPSPHTGKAMSEALLNRISGWELGGKIGTITLDNAYNNDAAVKRLKDPLFGDDLISRDLFHVRCNAHVLNLLVKAGLDHFDGSLDTIRESIKHVRSSQSKIQSFHEECVKLNMKPRTLPLDIETRWNSTYLMLEAAIPYQLVFDQFFDGSDYGRIPDRMDWNNVIVLKEFLKVFYESTKLFSGSKYVTSSAFCFQLSKVAMVLKTYSEQPRD